MDASAYFKGKKITVMGLGLLGRGIGDAMYLAECGAELIVTDKKTREQLAESVTQLESFPNITFVLGEHRLEDFRERDLILKAAGVPLDSPYIAEAKGNGIPVRMSADLFMELSGIQTIGVTGTRGKSTVTHMIADILTKAGKSVLLGGNVRGVSTLALLKESTPEHVAVLELDSWQCQGLAEAKVSPHIAVFTTLFPDHANYYKDDPGRYLADKANIFLYQSPDDTLVIGKQCAPTLIDTYGEHIVAKTVIADESRLPSEWVLSVPGLHNRYDAALALAAARASGVPDDASRAALAAFRGVPGRLEFLREAGGVRIYNDSNSTTPEATLAALAAVGGEGKRTILIMGGSDKGLDMSALLLKVPDCAKRVILLAGTGTDRILANLPDASVYDDLRAAFAEAMRYAEPGDTVLFSPAFASFGMFKNEYERSDAFARLAKELA
ncbi:MAG: UDP-N-acetylmuramoyl-L-alanine--D-glutamate ligase [Patescibacteria group bacterium]|nr:UDP-N-acetylmuramoyl-L-alanine--D-glutamate ligase [Patescibacteria group bacterium]MDE1966323.1 UDP-N-acetylmuramoyl-L-alanine--D-glutamate ligase [Patescibacteria group bacterium]